MIQQLDKLWKSMLLMVVGILAGTMGLCLVYCLPVETMQDHMSESVDSFMQEGDNPFLLAGYKGSSLDNWTDAIMLGNAVYKSELPALQASMAVQRAVNQKELTGEELDQEEGVNQGVLQRYLERGKAERVESYARYWHGYLLLLKPLLFFMNFQKIRLLNGVVALVLFLLVFRKLWKRGMKKGAAAFFLSVCSLFPMAIPYSLQFSTAYYTGMIACLILLYQYEQLEEKAYWEYFFLEVGICTSFVDFLTYPVFTFGMPLVLYLAIRKPNWKQGFIFLTRDGTFWGIGYLGMWIGKWIMGSLLTEENVLLDAVGTVGFRMSSSVYEEKISRILAVIRNFYIYFNIYGFLLAGILLIWVVYWMYKYKVQNCKDQLILMMMAAALPVIWYIATANHSYGHYWYTFRALAVSVFAVGMIPEMLE